MYIRPHANPANMNGNAHITSSDFCNRISSSSFGSAPMRATNGSVRLIKSWIKSLSLSYLYLLMSAAIAVNELLLRSKGGLVGLVCAVYQFEIISKFTMQTFRAISYNFQPTATFWAVGGKCGNNDMPTLSDCMLHNIYIVLAVCRLCQKMENSTVVPDVISLIGQICLRNISFDPIHINCMCAKPLAGKLQCGS